MLQHNNSFLVGRVRRFMATKAVTVRTGLTRAMPAKPGVFPDARPAAMGVLAALAEIVAAASLLFVAGFLNLKGV